jgi:SAM-dependent methyltransferase
MTETRDLEPKKVVRESYNRISRAYRGDAVSRDRGYFRWLAVLTLLLQPGNPVLDLGCGCGIPVAQELARTFRVTGVDISEVQIARARALVPEATLLCQDIMAVHFPSQTFAAIVAFFAIIHLPLPEQRPLFARLFSWMRPGGYLMVTVGHQAWTGYKDAWYGAPMYWSQTDEATYLAWLRDSGFVVQWREFLPEGNDGHVLVLAQRPGGTAALPGEERAVARAEHREGTARGEEQDSKTPPNHGV